MIGMLLDDAFELTFWGTQGMVAELSRRQQDWQEESRSVDSLTNKKDYWELINN